MGYVLERLGDNHFAITNDNSDCHVGYVSLRGGSYEIRDDDSEVITVVRSLDDAIPTLVAYIEKNPPQWDREGVTRYTKDTEYALLRVELEQPEQWLAFRDDHVLMRRGQSAIFSSSEEARRVADAHYREGYPNSEFIYDGFAWYLDPDPWWSYPNRVVALRGKLTAKQGQSCNGRSPAIVRLPCQF
jgi:hypothetical protein